MAIWVCRAGIKSIYINEFLTYQKIFCTWNGFRFDLNLYKYKDDLKKAIMNERSNVSSTTISTWASQLLILRDKMQIGDIVLSPNENSKSYNIGYIVGNYFYNENEKEHFYHSRAVNWTKDIVLREAFPQYVIYSLGAYRTIFRLKYEEEFYNVMGKLGIPIKCENNSFDDIKH